MPPDLEELRRRLIKRGTETPQQIELRLVNAAREMELWRDYRYTIISKSVEEDLHEVSPHHGRGTNREQQNGSGLTNPMNGNSKRKRERPWREKFCAANKAKSIVLGVTGSIAAYKSAELASLLVKQGHDVFVVMTHDATEFITPLTLQTLSKNPVTTSFYDEKESWRPGHIELADRADLLAHRARDRAHHRRTRARTRESSARRDRARDARANFARAGDERKNVGAPGDEGKCGDVESARRRIHRTGRRNARLRL